MIQLRHTGFYVQNLERMVDFYKTAFSMHVLCHAQEQHDPLIVDLLRSPKARVRISKLLTEQGKASGFDDMLELIEVTAPSSCIIGGNRYPIYAAGSAHLGFGVDDMKATLEAFQTAGGKLITEVRQMPNGKKCCFGQDIEGNYLEIIGAR